MSTPYHSKKLSNAYGECYTFKYTFCDKKKYGCNSFGLETMEIKKFRLFTSLASSGQKNFKKNYTSHCYGMKLGLEWNGKELEWDVIEIRVDWKGMEWSVVKWNWNEIEMGNEIQ